ASLKNPEEANLYLRMAMETYHEDRELEPLLLALRNIAEAKGGLTHLSQVTHLNRQNLYTVLSEKGNPTLSTFDEILKGLGYMLTIQPDYNSNSSEKDSYIARK